MSTLNVATIKNGATANITLDTAGNATVGNTLAMGSSFLRNRIINGDMRIDQRNAGASVGTGSGVGGFVVDRWQIIYDQINKYTAQQNAGSVTPPIGFSNYLGITSSSAYTVGSSEVFTVRQFIEGFNISDLDWGTANAKSITISFWVRSTGLSYPATLGGSITGYANTNSYPFTFSINASGTWEQKTITIPGPTSGTWNTTNGGGLGVIFGLGVGSSVSGTAGSWSASRAWSATGATSVVGTNGATFYITGVQFEVGSVATPFERRQYGQELALCQRYYQRFDGASGFTKVGNGVIASATVCHAISVPMKTQMRATPSLNYSGIVVYDAGVSATVTSIGNLSTSMSISLDATCSGGGMTTGRAGTLGANGAAYYFDASAEL